MPSILKYLNPIQKSFSHSFAFEDDLAELGISSQVLTPKTQAIPLSIKHDISYCPNISIDVWL